VNELNEELMAMKEAYEELDAEKQLVTSELERRSIETSQNQTKPTIGMFLLFCITHCEIRLLVFQREYHRIHTNNRLKEYVLTYLL
jgi:hypothetical protein